MADDQIPQPDTPDLLRFIDFIYAVVFTTFVRNVYDGVIFTESKGPSVLPWGTIDDEQLRILLLSACLFFVVATDWIHARVLTTHEKYVTYTRFFVDLGIAFVAYGILWLGAHGRPSSSLYVLLLFVGGMSWAALALWQDPQAKYRRKLRLILGSHIVGVGLLTWFCTKYGFDLTLTWQWLWRFAVVLGTFFLLEEILHVAALPKSQWLGPSGLPIPRWAIFWFAEKIKGAYRRLFNDPPDIKREPEPEQ